MNGAQRPGVCIAMDRILYRILSICLEGPTLNGGDSIDTQKSAHFFDTAFRAQKGAHFASRIMKNIYMSLF